MYCARCGNPIGDGNAFCASCGASVGAPPPAHVTQPVHAAPQPVYGAPYPPAVEPPRKKRTGCTVAVVIVIVLLLCGCCGVPAVLSATGQTIDLGEVTISDSVLEAIGVDKMIGDAIDTFFPWGDGDDGSGDGSDGDPYAP